MGEKCECVTKLMHTHRTLTHPGHVCTSSALTRTRVGPLDCQPEVEFVLILTRRRTELLVGI